MMLPFFPSVTQLRSHRSSNRAALKVYKEEDLHGEQSEGTRNVGKLVSRYKEKEDMLNELSGNLDSFAQQYPSRYEQTKKDFDSVFSESLVVQANYNNIGAPFFSFKDNFASIKCVQAHSEIALRALRNLRKDQPDLFDSH